MVIKNCVSAATYDKLHHLVYAVRVGRAARLARVRCRVQPKDGIENDRPAAPVERRVKDQLQVAVQCAVVLEVALQPLPRRAPCEPHHAHDDRGHELHKEVDPPLHVQVERRPDKPRLDVVGDIHLVVVVALAVHVVHDEDRHKHDTGQDQVPEKRRGQNQHQLRRRHMAQVQLAHGGRRLVARRLGDVRLGRPVKVVLHICVVLRVGRGRARARLGSPARHLVEGLLRRLHHRDARRGTGRARHRLGSILRREVRGRRHDRR